MQVDKTVWEWC